jgi:hypothetical protein
MADETTTDSLNATSINSAHPSSMAADRLTANLSTRDINSALPNFTIPRELRDMIYTYFLDGDYTRVQRKFAEIPSDQNQTGPKAYHFHTDILAVNHEIHAEAEESLYKSNVFVVVSYQWPSLWKEWGSLLWVPIVSNKFVNRMTLRSLRIHVDPGLVALQDAVRETRTIVPVKSYIILAGDLNGCCVTMHASNEELNAPAIIISTMSPTNRTLRFMG